MHFDLKSLCYETEKNFMTAEERELLTELHAAYENLDYEEGSELLSGRML